MTIIMADVPEWPLIFLSTCQVYHFFSRSMRKLMVLYRTSGKYESISCLVADASRLIAMHVFKAHVIGLSDSRSALLYNRPIMTPRSSTYESFALTLSSFFHTIIVK